FVTPQYPDESLLLLQHAPLEFSYSFPKSKNSPHHPPKIQSSLHLYNQFLSLPQLQFFPFLLLFQPKSKATELLPLLFDSSAEWNNLFQINARHSRVDQLPPVSQYGAKFQYISPKTSSPLLKTALLDENFQQILSLILLLNEPLASQYHRRPQKLLTSTDIQ